MEVILLERIEKLGQMGDVVRVKPGFARNYLLPQRKALRATEDNKKVFEAERKQLEAANLERKTEAEDMAGRMDDVSVILIRQAGDAGQLYGSVNARDIADAVTEAGFTVDRSQIVLPKPIKTLGLHDVMINLHPEVSVEVTVNVARTADEAETQASTGRAVLSAAEEERLADEQAVEEAAIEAAEAVDDQADELFEEEAREDAVEQAAAEVEAAEGDDAEAETPATTEEDKNA